MSVVGLQSPNRLPLIVFLYMVATTPGSTRVCSAKPDMAVSTIVLALPVASKASRTTSAVILSTVRIALSAPRPLVSSRANCPASAPVPTEWVAPSRSAASRLLASGSTAITYLAPANRAACTAFTDAADAEDQDGVTGAD